MTIRVISASDVRRLLPMHECIDVMERAMLASSSGRIRVPLRTFMPLVDDSAYFALMPGSSDNPARYGAKIIGLHDSNAEKGLPVIQGFIALFDHHDGTPLAIIEGASVTAIRTAAASALATRLLALPDASSHGVFGTGVQAASHIEAIACVRPIERVLLWGRNHARASALADAVSKRHGAPVVACESPREAAACSILSTVTASKQPFLEGAWVAPGTHVNLVGSHSANARESDSDLIAAASVFTDDLDSLLSEGGDVVIPIREGRINADEVRGEIGKVLAGDIDGRTSEAEITVYKSHGITAQDLFAAAHILEKAQAAEAGKNVPFCN